MKQLRSASNTPRTRSNWSKRCCWPRLKPGCSRDIGDNGTFGRQRRNALEGCAGRSCGSSESYRSCARFQDENFFEVAEIASAFKAPLSGEAALTGAAGTRLRSVSATPATSQKTAAGDCQDNTVDDFHGAVNVASLRFRPSCASPSHHLVAGTTLAAPTEWRNSSEEDTHPSSTSMASSDASWLLRGNWLPMGSPVQSSSRTQA